MVRTQIQLPDEVFAQAKKVCQDREISLAELARRGIEYILGVYSTTEGAKGEWHPPKPQRLGWRGLNDSELKEQAQLSASEVSLRRRGRK